VHYTYHVIQIALFLGCKIATVTRKYSEINLLRNEIVTF
jgi:hypothetical protein